MTATKLSPEQEMAIREAKQGTTGMRVKAPGRTVWALRRCGLAEDRMVTSAPGCEYPAPHLTEAGEREHRRLAGEG